MTWELKPENYSDIQAAIENSLMIPHTANIRDSLINAVQAVTYQRVNTLLKADFVYGKNASYMQGFISALSARTAIDVLKQCGFETGNLGQGIWSNDWKIENSPFL